MKHIFRVLTILVLGGFGFARLDAGQQIFWPSINSRHPHGGLPSLMTLRQHSICLDNLRFFCGASV
jgi:hypothetical protein